MIGQREVWIVVWCAASVTMLAGCGSCGQEDQDPPRDGRDASPDLTMAFDQDTSDLSVEDPKDMPQNLAVDMPQDMGAPISCVPGDPARDEAQLYTVGAWEVEVMTQRGTWRVSGPGGEFSSAVSPCDGGMRVGSGEPLVQMLFGAWKVKFETSRLMWREVATSAPTITPSGDTLTLTWPLQGVDGRTASLVFSPEAGEHLRVQLETDWQEATAGGFSQRCVQDEAFFGLGTQTTGMDLRGGIYPLWTQEQGIDKPEDGGLFPLQNVPEAAYAPMGVLHSSAGWSAVLRPDSYTELDLCKRDPSTLRTTTYRQLPAWVFVAGETPRARLTAVTDYTGRITTPARWTFGPWNDTVGGPARVAEVAAVLRDNDIPSSAIWSEDWIGGDLTANGYRLSYAWEWDPETYPDLPDDIDRLHAEGFAFLAYFNTFVVSTTRMWEEGLDGGFVIKDEEGEVYELTDPGFRKATMVDLTNPAARAWLGGYLRTAAKDLKIDGWMADFTEWLPHDAVLASGQSGWEAHNQFPLLWQQLNRDVLTEVHASEPDPNNWVFWVRSGWASTQGGSGGLTPTMWGGDQNTDWGVDDGLPSVIPIGAHVGMSGVPIFGSDIAGYSWIGQGDLLSTKELYFRWTALGAFHPLMRTHQGAAKCRNWSFDRDADTLAHYRRYASLHTLLLPYFEQLAIEAQSFGWPITRHPYMVFPDEPALWEDDHYVHFLGDQLLIAPVIEEGATQRDVTLPEGALWWALLGGEPGEVTSGVMQAAVTEIPVFVRGGTMLPLLGEVVDSFYGATQEGVTDLEDVAGHYRVAIYASESGELDAAAFGAEQVTVSAQGVKAAFMQSPPLWSQATWNGEVVPSCDASTSVTCYGADHVRVEVEGSPGELRLGEATWTIGSVTAGVRLELYRGSDAFGPWRAATPLDQGLDSMAPPVCDSSKD